MLIALLPVLAADSPVDPDLLFFSALWVTIAAAVIPVVTAVVTRFDAHPFVKFVIATILSAVSSLVQVATVADGVAVISKQTALLIVFQAIATLVAYNSVHAPAFHLNERVLPGRGLMLVRDPDTTYDGEKFTNRRTHRVVLARRAA